MSKISAILVMGGSGERFGSNLPKQFHPISGKKIYIHTFDRIYHSKLFHEIILVTHADWVDLVKKDLSSYLSVKIIAGGKTRQESSYLGLLACLQDTEYVVIHDAVRPFVSLEILQKNVSAVQEYKAVDTCIPSADTLVYAPNQKEIESIPNRSEYLRGQTPQSFAYSLIKNAHEKAIEDNHVNASDDCQLVIRMGKKVHVVTGEDRNLKITTELDLFLAEQYFRLEQKVIEHSGDFSSLKGKTIAITGGSGGIGKEIERQLFEAGAIPINLSRRSMNYPIDLTNPKDVEEMFQRIYQEYGHLDGLINSVGFLRVKELDLLTSQEVDHMIDVNLNALIYSCQYAKIKPEGHIINIASSSYSKGRKDLSIYACTKAAVVNFTQGLAEERPMQRVNVVVPQRTATPMRYENFPGEDKNELLSPEKVAFTILEVLIKDEMTGSIIEVRRS